MGRGGIKRVGAGDNRKESARGTLGREKRRRESFPARPRFFFFFNLHVLSLFFPFCRRFPIEGASAEERGKGLFLEGLIIGILRYVVHTATAIPCEQSLLPDFSRKIEKDSARRVQRDMSIKTDWHSRKHDAPLAFGSRGSTAMSSYGISWF